MTSKLCTLAVELIEHIASVLEPLDLFSLRLVCKGLNEKTLHYFARTYLTTVQTDLSYKSLKELKELSAHEQLSHHIQTLLIKEGLNDIGRGFLWNRHPSDHLLAPLSGIQMLQDILLNNLVNCRSFHIYGAHAEEDLYESDWLTSSDAIAIILTIIAETSLPIRSFYVDFRKWGTGKVDAKRLHTLQYQKPEFRTAWTHLQELCLEQSMTLDTFDWALRLVLCATNLQKLTLDFEFDHSISFIDRLSSTDSFPKLQELKLSCAYVTVELISRFLLRFRDSLRALLFRHIIIDDDSGGTWISVLSNLRSNLPLLESICVNHLKEFKPGEKGRITFPALSDNPVVPGLQGGRFELIGKKFHGSPRIFGVSYCGPRMDVALEILARSAEYI
ncbi:MAG: hypothetical protein M1830_006871 [Pleopsidium flavum]|nr:MAG: hypothetical protein M1830_006871 [Pleopsidium flavum]